MRPMICVVPFHSKDAPNARNLLRWITELGGCKNRNAILVADAGCNWAMALDMQRLANQAFGNATLVCTDESYTEPWPVSANRMFYYGSQYIHEHVKQPFLWLEPDAVPLKPGWLDSIAGEYQGGFLGHIYKFDRPDSPFAPIDVMSGVAVYPSDAFQQICGCIKVHPKTAWDVSAAGPMIKTGWHTEAIHNFFGGRELPPTFTNAKTSGCPVNTLALSEIGKGAVLFHRNKDGTLIKLLRDRLSTRGFRAHAGQKADFVSLRRAGDIVILLPLLKVISEQRNRPVRLVVHKDFLNLFEGVSYVRPCAWDGDWEDPLAAATHWNAVNAQVFGRGLSPNTKTENFAKVAWAKLGYNWNRYLPLVFDWRDYEREEALAKSVIKTEKPVILVKLHGHSSPFHEGKFVLDNLAAQFGDKAEIVNLDEIKADRLYDLIGLMDRAACLITIDTVTLWLAHASRVPVIAFHSSGFGASPPRGNCIFRIPYVSVKPRWAKVSEHIKNAIIPRHGDGMVLVYSDWRPSDPDTQRRNSAAMNTWSNLGARFYPFRSTRKFVPDPNAQPFIRDMIAGALSSGAEEIVVITNNDIKMDPRLGAAIRKSCYEYGCYWAMRTSGPGADTDRGADLFAFTRSWWTIHQHMFPDILLGYYWWDQIMTKLMQWSGCQEQPRLYYHEPHKGVLNRLNDAGQAHNVNTAKAWLAANDE